MHRRLSATRLNQFLGCAHRSALWLAGEQEPEDSGGNAQLVREKGLEHEARVLGQLELTHGAAVRVPFEASMDARVLTTLEALRNGAPLVYQAALITERWIAFPDFLVKIGRSDDGRSLYEPQDAKLARQAKAEHVLQLGVYARLLGELAKSPTQGGTIHVGRGDPVSVNLAGTRHITARLMGKLEAFADLPQRSTEPVRCAACAQCGFLSRCESEWRAADSPIFVAGIRIDQVEKLAKAGIGTLSVLAELNPVTRVDGIAPETIAKLTQQARLQRTAAKTGKPLVELLPIETAEGFRSYRRPRAPTCSSIWKGTRSTPRGSSTCLGCGARLRRMDARGSKHFGPTAMPRKRSPSRR